MARAIKGVVEAEQKKVDPFFVYNVGSNSFTYKIKDLAQAVASSLSFEPTVEINHEAAADNRSYKVDFSRFNKDFPHFMPEQDLPEVVLELEKQISQLVEINGEVIELDTTQSIESIGNIFRRKVIVSSSLLV